jgi:hypothetical protein
MRKKINLILIFFLICVPFTFTAKILASVPLSNTMQLGEITSLLPAEEMRAYFQKMEPVYQQYFGPPFSNIKLLPAPNLKPAMMVFPRLPKRLNMGIWQKYILKWQRKIPKRR